MSDHADDVFAVVSGSAIGSSDSAVADSWRRGAIRHRIDPASNEPPQILIESEIANRRTPLEALIGDSAVDLDRLYRPVREGRYTVLLCDVEGVAIEHRGNCSQSEEFKYWGTWLGGVWSEEGQGTNGIGTCIAECRPVTVHRTEHFRPTTSI